MSRISARLPLLSLLFLAACVSVEGQTPKELKRAFLNSNTVESLTAYYPDGVPSDPSAYRSPTKAGAAKIRSRTAKLSSFLVDLHNKRRPSLERILKRTVEPAQPIRLKILEVNRPVAKVASQSEVQVSFPVMRAVFRGALLENILASPARMSLRNPLTAEFDGDDQQFTFDESFQPQNATAEQQQALARIAELTEEVRSTKAPGALGTMASAFSDDEDWDEGPWFKLTDIMEELEGSEISYAGALLFLLAHEQGHIVLKHQEQLGSQCSDQIALENEADEYALVLLSLLTGDRTVPEWLIPQGRPGAFTGYRNFLQYSYPLSGFKEGGCAYPSNKARFEHLAAKHRGLQLEAQAEFMSLLEHGTRESEKQLKKKYGVEFTEDDDR